MSQRAAYSYERRYFLYSYLRRVPGRRRRVRIEVYRTVVVEVPAREYERKGSTKKRQAGKKAVQRTAKGSTRLLEKSVRVRSGVTEKEARQEQLEAIRRGFAEAPEARKKPSDQWLNVVEYHERISVELSFKHGLEVVGAEMPIFHDDRNDDVINLGSLFVWPAPHHPTRMKVKARARGSKTPFTRVRIWFWVRHDEDDVAEIWSRTMTHPYSDFKGAGEYAKALWEAVKEDIHFSPLQGKNLSSRGSPYNNWTPQELLAWTTYLSVETMPTKPKKIKIGGSGA